MRRGWGILGVALAASLAGAAIELKPGADGGVSLIDPWNLGSLRVLAWDQEWASEGRLTGVRGTLPGKLEGTLKLPGKAVGEAAVTLEAEPREGGFRFRVAATLSAATRLNAFAVQLELPLGRLHGRELWACPNGPFIAVGSEPFSESLQSAAVAAQTYEGEALLLVSHGRPVTVQDNRRFGAHTCSFRIGLASGDIPAGLRVHGSFSLILCPADEANDRSRTFMPAVSYDPSRPALLVDPDGTLQLRGPGGSAAARVTLAVHGREWALRMQADNNPPDSELAADERRFQGSLLVPGAEPRAIVYDETIRPTAGGFSAEYHLTRAEPANLNGHQLSWFLPITPLLGRTLELVGETGKRLTIPRAHGELHLASQVCREVRLWPERADGLTIAVEPPTPVLVQDNRRFGADELELRFQLGGDMDRPLPAGEARLALQVKPTTPVQVLLAAEQVQQRTDTAGWAAYPLPWDDCPVDVSFLQDAPAGKHGFLTCRDGRFVFADGTPARFWGTCFSAGENFPTHEQAEKIARRLAKFGVNIVRTHHADADWAQPNLFAFGGKSTGNTTEFMPESLDRFDYLLACLKREGIYIYLDQLVNRKFTAADGVDAADQLERAGKPYSNFDPRLIEVQQKFSRALLTHVNPYTGLAYRDEPAVALLEFANENDLLTQQVTLEPYRTRLEERYRAWAAGKGLDVPPGKVVFGFGQTPVMQFLVEVQRDYYTQMTGFMRELGVKIPLTGSNWSRNAALVAALDPMPYTDSHAYHDHPSGNRFGNRSFLGQKGNMMSWLSLNRVAGKPFFVSEWDTPWPNEWRAELPLWLAAVAALQDWGGLTVYTYRHTADVPCDQLSGAFETFNDACRFGLFPAAALIYRRGDVAEARQKVTITIPRDKAVAAGSPGPWNMPALSLTPEIHRTEVTLDAPGPRAGKVVAWDQRGVPDGNDVRSDTGQLRRVAGEAAYGSIDSPRTQAAYGHLAAAGELKLADVRLKVATPFAVVAVSSLSNDPLRTARRILITAVARAENTGFAYTAERNGTADKGAGPILIEPVNGTLTLRTERKGWTAVPVRADGIRGEPLPLRAAGREVTLTLGGAGTIYYLLQAP